MKSTLFFAAAVLSQNIMAQSEVCTMKDLPDADLFTPDQEMVKELVSAIDSGESEHLIKHQDDARWMRYEQNKIVVCIPGKLDESINTCGRIVIKFEKKHNDWGWVNSEITTCHRTI